MMSDQEHVNNIGYHCRQLTAAIQEAQMAGLKVDVRLEQVDMTSFTDPNQRWLTFVRPDVSRLLKEARVPKEPE